MRIKKLKMTKEGEIKLEYEARNANTKKWDKLTLETNEKPLPSLNTALQNLAPYVKDICELPDGVIHLTGLSMSYGGDEEVPGAVLVAQRTLKNSYQPMNLTTPHKASGSYNPGGVEDPKQVMPDNMMRDINVVLTECERYIKGERAQGDLFEEGATN